jgi:cyclase
MQSFQEAGVGEIVINSVDRDGLMQGYDLDLARQIKSKVKIPLTFLGGAGSHEHLKDLISQVGTIGVAAGSLFVFKGSYRAVLINYPTPEQKIEICQEALRTNNIKGDFFV